MLYSSSSPISDASDLCSWVWCGASCWDDNWQTRSTFDPQQLLQPASLLPIQFQPEPTSQNHLSPFYLKMFPQWNQPVLSEQFRVQVYCPERLWRSMEEVSECLTDPKIFHGISALLPSKVIFKICRTCTVWGTICNLSETDFQPPAKSWTFAWDRPWVEFPIFQSHVVTCNTQLFSILEELCKCYKI